jgi:hypothetical protein
VTVKIPGMMPGLHHAAHRVALAWIAALLSVGSGACGGGACPASTCLTGVRVLLSDPLPANVEYLVRIEMPEGVASCAVGLSSSVCSDLRPRKDESGQLTGFFVERTPDRLTVVISAAGEEVFKGSAEGIRYSKTEQCMGPPCWYASVQQ